jgi:hypothetical protein
VKTLTLPQLKKKVWEQFSLYIRLRDAAKWQEAYPEYNGDPVAPCVTCGKMYPATGKGCGQAGHFIPGRKNVVLFDEEQVNFQCYNCNYRLNGNWPSYYEVMVKRHGLERVEEMLENRNTVLKYTVPQLEELLEHYTSEVNRLKSQI